MSADAPVAISPELAERAARPGLAAVWRELARRMEMSSRPVTRIRLRELDDETRHAVADLFGSARLPDAAGHSMSVADIAAALGIDPTDEARIRAVVESVVGPVRDRSAERRAVARKRAELWAWLAEQVQDRPALAAWVRRIVAAGVPNGDVLRHRERLRLAVDVLGELPFDGEPLGSIASRVAGDPHALDHGSRLAAITLDAIACLMGEQPPTNAEETRALWERAGAVTDGLSSTVLVAGFEAEGDDPLAANLRALAAAREPAAITRSQLRRWPVRPAAPAQVLAFENPAMLAMAVGLGVTCPMVCTSGWPNVAVIVLLRQLATAGHTVRYHGDFDERGIAIANHLRDRVGVVPWQMTADAYEAAPASTRTLDPGLVPATPWDPPLATAMRERRLAVYEEAVASHVLALLVAPRPACSSATSAPR